MDIYGALAIVGVLAAFGCGFTLVLLGSSRLRRRALATAMHTGTIRSGHLAWLLRNGVRWTDYLARVLLGNPCLFECMDAAVEELKSKGFQTSSRALLSMAIAVVITMMLSIIVITHSPLAALAAPAFLCVIAIVHIRSYQDMRQERLRESIPEALTSMAVCFQSGFSLLQTLQQVSGESVAPLKKVFGRALHRLEAGRSAQEALSELRESATVAELSFVAVALDVQHQVGGSLKQIIEAARDTIEGELALRRSLRVQTAQARLSARIVSVMPFALIALFSLVSKGFLSPFFQSPLGLFMLFIALAMQAAGILLVRRVLAVEVA